MVDYEHDGERYSWHNVKARDNVTKHGIAFEEIHDFDWDGAIKECNHDRGEQRLKAIGILRAAPPGREKPIICVVIYTEEPLKGKRLISLRPADEVEQRRYAERGGAAARDLACHSEQGERVPRGSMRTGQARQGMAFPGEDDDPEWDHRATSSMRARIRHSRERLDRDHDR